MGRYVLEPALTDASAGGTAAEDVGASHRGRPFRLFSDLRTCAAATGASLLVEEGEPDGRPRRRPSPSATPIPADKKNDEVDTTSQLAPPASARDVDPGGAGEQREGTAFQTALPPLPRRRDLLASVRKLDCNSRVVVVARGVVKALMDAAAVARARARSAPDLKSAELGEVKI